MFRLFDYLNYLVNIKYSSKIRRDDRITVRSNRKPNYGKKTISEKKKTFQEVNDTFCVPPLLPPIKNNGTRVKSTMVKRIPSLNYT
jgi:hypothetical protein